MSNTLTAVLAVAGFSLVLLLVWLAIKVRRQSPPAPKLTEEEKERIRREIHLDSDVALSRRFIKLLRGRKSRR